MYTMSMKTMLPAQTLIKMIKKSDNDLRRCQASPMFTDTKSVMTWLNTQ